MGEITRLRAPPTVRGALSLTRRTGRGVRDCPGHIAILTTAHAVSSDARRLFSGAFFPTLGRRWPPGRRFRSSGDLRPPLRAPPRGYFAAARPSPHVSGAPRATLTREASSPSLARPLAPLARALRACMRVAPCPRALRSAQGRAFPPLSWRSQRGAARPGRPGTRPRCPGTHFSKARASPGHPVRFF